MARRREPRWLSRLAVEAIHADQIREHGGLRGLRDENALESALARPRQHWHYARSAHLEDLAAAYAYGLVRNHPFRDGNKRLGFLTLVTFLDINGLDFDAPETDVVTTMVRLAEGSLTEEQLAAWVRAHTSR